MAIIAGNTIMILKNFVINLNYLDTYHFNQPSSVKELVIQGKSIHNYIKN